MPTVPTVPIMFTNPGLGLYDLDSAPIGKDKIYHIPGVGYQKTEGRWCPICKETNQFSWISITDKKCEVCQYERLK